MEVKKTPLIDLLRGVPEDARHALADRHIPYGRFCHEAADEIDRLRGRVAKLEKETQFLRGAHARCRIELDLAESLLDPNYETTAMDEEYRTSLHDRIQAMVARAGVD
jgi:hypothetical protein